MKAFGEKVKKYRQSNKITMEALATKIQLSLPELRQLEKGELSIDDQQKNKITECLGLPVEKQSKSKKVVRILDLIFRFGGCIMAIVTLLLSINGIAKVETLVALLSIGVVCSTITLLPKIEK